MDYDAMVFYFYPFGMERISALLSEKLSKHVVHKCKELTDETANLYVYENRKGKLYNGIVMPGDISVVKEGTAFTLERFYFWYEFCKTVSRERYDRIRELSNILETKQYLYSDYTCVYEIEEGIEIGDLCIQKYHRMKNNTLSKQKEVYTHEEVKEIYQILRKIHNEIKDYVDVVNPEITFSSQNQDEEFNILMITSEDDENINLGVCSTQSENIKEYQKNKGISLEIIEGLGDVYLPVDNIDFINE